MLKLLFLSFLVALSDGALNDDLQLDLKWGTNTSGVLVKDHPGSTGAYTICVDPYPNGVADRRWAEVACRTLGLDSKMALNVFAGRYLGTKQTFSTPLQLNCSDDAPASECGIIPHFGFCLPPTSRLSALICTDEAPEYRLGPEFAGTGIHQLQARVRDEDWGAVCARNNGTEFATVACRSLNMSSTNVQSYARLFNGGDIQAALVTANCTGNESRVEDCGHSRWAGTCPFDDYLGLVCAEANEGDVRVSDFRSGKTQIFKDGDWLAVGVNGSQTGGLHEATVVCRSLNMSVDTVTGMVGNTTESCWLQISQCTGNESSILECGGGRSSLADEPFPCKPFQVNCEAEIDLRIGEDGLLQVMRHGLWGSVCASTQKNFRNYAASIVCKSFKKPSTLSSASFRKNTSPRRDGPIWYSGLECPPSAKHWRDCTLTSALDCSHDEDIFIDCQDVESVEYRLSKTVLPNVGVAEVKINGVWGAVCSSGYHSTAGGILDNRAKTICSSVGKTVEGARFTSQYSSYDPQLASKKVWLDAAHLTCKNVESGPVNCSHQYFGDNDCQYPMDFPTIYCGPPQSTPDFSLRLSGGKNETEGRLEMMVYNQWGTVCDRNFTQRDAVVACNQVANVYNYPNTKVAPKGTYGQGSGVIWLSHVNCNGTVSSLSQCGFPPLGINNCSHGQDVGIICPVNPLEPGPNIGLIVGCSVGGVAALVIVVGAVYFIVKKKKKGGYNQAL